MSLRSNSSLMESKNEFKLFFFRNFYLYTPTTPACTWWNRLEEDLSSGKLVSTHPTRTVVKSIEVFMESSQLYAATLTHYSTEPLTTGPNYDPLLLLLALAGDVHPNPGPSRYPCSVCFKNVTSQGTSYLCTRCSHWVHSRCSGHLNTAEYALYKLNCMVLLLLYMYIVYDSPLNLLDIGL